MSVYERPKASSSSPSVSSARAPEQRSPAGSPAGGYDVQMRALEPVGYDAQLRALEPALHDGGLGVQMRALTRAQPAEAVQRKDGGAGGADAVHAAAAAGTATSSAKLPHAEAIQASFGGHDVSGVKAHSGAEATRSAEAMGARAYASGDHVVFGGSPSLHTAAHEAAHVVQQRAGVQLKGGVGQTGDAYERHADAVADLVVQGKSAQGLLDGMAGGARGGASGTGPVQMEPGLKKGAKVNVDNAGDLVKAEINEVLKPNRRKDRPWHGYRVKTEADEVVDTPEVNVTKLQTEAGKLKDKFGAAKRSADPEEKAEFLRDFNENYAGDLTGEIEYFQMLAQRLVYLRLQTGQEIACNVDTSQRHGLERRVGEDLADRDSDYSANYIVAARYTNMKSASVLLLLPKDGDLTRNAIITFRGTAAGQDGMSREEGESRGVRADLDGGGIGKGAFELATPTLMDFLNTAKQYNKITISGHSLGGAMAQRFYTLASREVPDKLRLLVYQSAPVDKATAEEAKRNTEGTEAKATRVQANGDVVTRGGAAHVPGQRISYDSKKSSAGKTHTQTDLVDAQINKYQTPVDLMNFANSRFSDLVENVEVKDKTQTTSKTKLTLNAGRVFLGKFNGRKKEASNYDERLEIMDAEQAPALQGAVDDLEEASGDRTTNAKGGEYLHNDEERMKNVKRRSKRDR